MAERAIHFLIPHHYGNGFADGFPDAESTGGDGTINNLFDGDIATDYETTALLGVVSAYVATFDYESLDGNFYSTGWFLENHNLYTADTSYIKVRYYTAGDYTGDPALDTVYGGGTKSGTQVVVDSDDDIYVTFNAPLSSGFDRWRWSAWSTGNFGAELEAGQLWFGQIFQPDAIYSYGQGELHKGVVKKFATSLSGTQFTQQKQNKNFFFVNKEFSLNFDFVDSADLALFRELYKRTIGGQPFKMILIEPDSTIIHYTVAFTQDLNVTTQDSAYHNVTLNLEEVDSDA